MRRRTKRVIQYGTHFLLQCIAVIGIVLVGYALLSRHHIRWDLTQNKRFTLSEQTLKVLKSLNKPVKITAFWKAGTVEAEQVEDLLRQYAYRSRYIQFEVVDPDKNPALTSQFGVTEYGTTVFQCQDKRKDVPERDVFPYTFSPFGPSRMEFHGENAFTSALLEVTSEEKKVIYFLTGHREKDIYSAEREGYSKVRNYLEKENFEVRTLNLVEKGEIPEDADTIVIAGPKSNLVEKEKDLLISFWEKGGNLLILVDPGVPSSWIELVESLGLEIKPGMVIDPARCYFGEAGAPIPDYRFHTITEDLSKTKSACIFASATGVDKKEGGEVILESSPSSWLEKDYLTSGIKFDQGKDVKGPIPLGVVREVKEEEKSSRVALFGDSDFPSNSLIVVQGNVDLFLNTVNWLSKEEIKISIRPRLPERREMKLSRKEALFVYITSLYIIPLLIFSAGFTVWWRRRSL